MKLYWLIQMLAYLSLVICIIPRKYLKRLFGYAFLGGFIYTWIAQGLAVHALNLWAFEPTSVMIFSIPLFFVVSWFGATYLYGYFILMYPKYQFYILFFFVILTSLNFHFAKGAGMVKLLDWDLSQTLMFAIFSHVFLILLAKWLFKVGNLGPSEDILQIKGNK